MGPYNSHCLTKLKCHAPQTQSVGVDRQRSRDLTGSADITQQTCNQWNSAVTTDLSSWYHTEGTGDVIPRGQMRTCKTQWEGGGRQADSVAGFSWLFHTKQKYFLEKSQQHILQMWMICVSTEWYMWTHLNFQQSATQLAVRDVTVCEKVFPFQFCKLLLKSEKKKTHFCCYI